MIEHRWRTVCTEHGPCPIQWQECEDCGARRYVSSYIGADGQVQEESHAWPEHLPDVVREALVREEIDHPAHYGGEDDPYEAIKVIDAWGLGFSLGNALKYIRRAGLKEGESRRKDLEKALWYIRHEIDREDEP